MSKMALLHEKRNSTTQKKEQKNEQKNEEKKGINGEENLRKVGNDNNEGVKTDD